MLMERRRAQLLIIDVQSRLVPHVAGGERVARECRRLLDYARLLDVPVTLTEHYPDGLGPTVVSLIEATPPESLRLEKIAFSCLRDDAIRYRIQRLVSAGRDQIVVAGMEAHVCVGQTVLDLVGSGQHVFLVSDAVGSRSDAVRDLAIARMRSAGVHIVTQEMVAFEWLERGDAPGFKAIVQIVKQA
jgi:nicotinamidase-related amidase